MFSVEFDAVTYDRFMDLAKSSDNPGLMIVPSYDYYDDAGATEIYDPWFKDLVQDVWFMQEMYPSKSINHIISSLNSWQRRIIYHMERN